jgi:hypothetical protein
MTVAANFYGGPELSTFMKRVAMVPIKAVGQIADVTSAGLSKTDLTHPVDEFSQVLKSEQTLTSDAEKRSQAILHFYDIHQRSQITGVPIPEYNAAVAALGLDAEKDPFAAIQVLQEAGFETGAPTLGAILKYGAAPQTSGNQSYLAQAGTTARLPTVALPEPESEQALTPAIMPDTQAVTQEVQALSTQFGNLLGPATNYFEAATQLAKQIDLQPYMKFTLDQALPMIQDALQLNQSVMTTDRWLQSKL